MARVSRKSRPTPRSSTTTKYDANNIVLEKTYGAFADLRRELADSKAAVAERTGRLLSFANCTDPQRAWLLLEDYFERLSLSRKDFTGEDWWKRLMAAHGKARLEETALLFLRANRPLPTELVPHANLERFAEIEQSEQEQNFVQQLEHWLLPPAPSHLDAPRAGLRVQCEVRPLENQPGLQGLGVQFVLSRPRTGEKTRSLGEVIELTTRTAHEQELFPPEDWQFIQWLVEIYGGRKVNGEPLFLTGSELLQWLARWGHHARLELNSSGATLAFHGQLAELTPHLETAGSELVFTHRLKLPGGECHPLDQAQFFAGPPSLALFGHTFYLLRDPPPHDLLIHWAHRPSLPARKLSHRLLTHLRKNGSNWEQLCVAHAAVPQFVFELTDDSVRLRLLAKSARDQTVWQWNGHEWQLTGNAKRPTEKPEILDDPRLDPATQWLRRLDWFTPEPGLWVGDANQNFLNALAVAWPERPDAEYLGNAAFQRLFLSPRQLRPKLMVHGSGIDWLSVSAEWEEEGMKLTPADLQRLQTATGRFVKLPDSGWIQLDTNAVQTAHETMADLGIDGLSNAPQKVALLHAAQLDDASLQRFGDPQAGVLRRRIAEFDGVESTPLPDSVKAELRPYQKAGFDFLCHLTHLKLGGVLADDMGLGKTLQTLAWLAWLREQNIRKPRPALVICPASVLHNWRREGNRFTPQLKVLVLESGAARHNLRKQIPQHDLIVTNYALLRRDLEALQKFEFRAIILDEAQFIKNPSAQVTLSVKQLRADQRLALTGTPLENRLLDLWSIVDFIQPGYLGSQNHFNETYEPRGGEDAAWAQKIARRRLAAKLRPLMLRRLKRQVAQDLPDRIEERRDCELGDEQRKLYLAELRRSREKVMQTVAEKGVAKSKIHVLAALTRLRQVCCHPDLVGNDSLSGKTETLFELLEPLLAEGQKVLVFSQFVQMLQILEKECRLRQIPTHILTGETKDRQEVVNAFQTDSNAAVFLLSLRAAGTGLNLTTASYVVLYDPWWNPAVEAQAIDRSHRIGQTRTVNAYRLIAPGTVEEKIWELQQRKAQTISDVLGEEGFARNLSKDDLEYLFSVD
ncbi:MAG: serine/threonine protein phosphatase [Verrucomicrobia bacterium]|nr:MAG: serine/threonine protein phosphatase [Verrucomicrobiota bacterium]